MLKVQDPTGKMLKVGFMMLPERSGNFQAFQHFVTHHISNIPRWRVTKDNYLNKRSHTQPKPVFRSTDKPFPLATSGTLAGKTKGNIHTVLHWLAAAFQCVSPDNF